mgnify:FL=1
MLRIRRFWYALGVPTNVVGNALIVFLLQKKESGSDVVSASDIPFEGGATPRPLTV